MKRSGLSGSAKLAELMNDSTKRQRMKANCAAVAKKDAAIRTAKKLIEI